MKSRQLLLDLTSLTSSIETMLASGSRKGSQRYRLEDGLDQSDSTLDVPLDEGEYDDDEGDGLENV